MRRLKKYLAITLSMATLCTGFTLIDNTSDRTVYGAEENKDGFVIENNVLVKYTGSDTEIVIPDEVTRIGDAVFGLNKNITSVTIPEGVISIGDGAFGQCSALTDITIPDSVAYIGENAFLDTAWLNNKIAENPLVIESDIVIEGSKCSGKVIIPDGTTSICDTAFAFGDITEFEIPQSVTYIGYSAFVNTPWLTAQREENPLVIVNDILVDGFEYKGDLVIPNYIRSIAGRAFYGNVGMKSVLIPSSVQDIGKAAFGSCSVLSKVDIANGVKYIDDDAFASCTSLSTITIPPSVIKMGNGIFGGCVFLSSAKVFANIDRIEDEMFMSCMTMTNVLIPASVKEFGEDVFEGCMMLRTLTGYAGSYTQTYASEHGYSFNVTTEKPVISETPIESLVPTISSTPVASIEPTASQKPAASIVPTASQKPAASIVPTASQKPAASIVPTASQKPTASTNPQESAKEFDFYDVNGDKNILLADAQTILKYALKIQKSDKQYTLSDAQFCLKLALKIVTLK